MFCKRILPVLGVLGGMHAQAATFHSVKNWGAVGDGIHNDRPNIQKAINSGLNLYFPGGEYLLADKTNAEAFLFVTHAKQSLRYKFSTEALLKVGAHVDSSYIKPTVLMFLATHGVMKAISIDGIRIDGNKSQNQLQINGMVICAKEYRIQNLNLSKATIQNCMGEAIHLEVENISLADIVTSNNDKHDLAINNHHVTARHVNLLVQNFTSTNCGKYSIDFGGPEIGSDPRQADNSYTFSGKVYNLISTHSKYGIKTAGNWKLHLQHCKILDSENNGFYHSKSSPNARIFANELTISRAANIGLSLFGNGRFIGRNIHISNCGVGMQIDSTDATLHKFKLTAGPMYRAGIRLGVSNITLKNFELINGDVPDDYICWVSGKKVILANGVIKNSPNKKDVIIFGGNDIQIKNVVSYKPHSMHYSEATSYSFNEHNTKARVIDFKLVYQ